MPAFTISRAALAASLTVAASLPAKFELEPAVFGGVESQLATNGSTTFAAVNNLPLPMTVHGAAVTSATFSAAILKATGEMVAVNQDTGKIEWDTRLPSSPYGAAAVTNDVVFTTTLRGDLYALDAATGAILSKAQQPLIIAYQLGAHGQNPDRRNTAASPTRPPLILGTERAGFPPPLLATALIP